MSLQAAYNDFVSNLSEACPVLQRARYEQFKEEEEHVRYLYEDMMCEEDHADAIRAEADLDRAKAQFIRDSSCGGWILSDFDTQHKCPIHFDGQEQPEL